MASAAWVQGRVNRMLRQTYTRQPRTAVASPDDSWGNPIEDYVPANAVQNVPCLFLDEGSYVLAPGGPIQLERNTLIISADDPLTVGDQVLNVVDIEQNRLIYPGPGTVQMIHDSDVSGPVIFHMVSMLEGETIG